MGFPFDDSGNVSWIAYMTAAAFFLWLFRPKPLSETRHDWLREKELKRFRERELKRRSGAGGKMKSKDSPGADADPDTDAGKGSEGDSSAPANSP